MSSISVNGSNASQAPNAPDGAWDRAVQVWLYVVAGLVVLMIGVGGATRLTDSGLSITEWRPIMGALPPLSQQDWLDAFAKYQQIPEYHLVNKGMSLDGFKFIFWWEWSHRFLGRFIGLAFALPLLVFWVRGALRPGLGWPLLGLLALGGLQGAIGWYMVSSGLVDRVDVSHYRLALHLTVAFVLLAGLVWIGRGLCARSLAGTVREPWLRWLAVVTVFVMFGQVVLGAFVAGLKGGLVHNTWPLMSGALVPDDMWALSPWFVNPVENPAMAQFNHRLIAYVLAGLVAWQAWYLLAVKRPNAVRQSMAVVVCAVVLQIALGVWTLLAAVPIALGVAHQTAAALVLVAMVRHAHVVLRGAL